MEEFGNKINIRVKTSINKTENIEKITNAVENIVKIKYITTDMEIIGTTDNYRELKNLYEVFRNKQTTHIARKVLLKNLQENTSQILFNKQAAAVNSIVICDKMNESPLGPIIMEIETTDIEEFIDWFVPKHTT